MWRAHSPSLTLSRSRPTVAAESPDLQAAVLGLVSHSRTSTARRAGFAAIVREAAGLLIPGAREVVEAMDPTARELAKHNSYNIPLLWPPWPRP